MNLLPKSKEEFGQKAYWDSFFKKRGYKTFEWYGEYPTLSGYLHKYMKTQDDVLVPGCGNSKLSQDLYDVGYERITNIDISPIVIRQMRSQNDSTRPKMAFLQMDALDMSFDDDRFSVVLDKGTLDALTTDDDPTTTDKVMRYFGEVRRVLRPNGRYVCVSLLQEHVLGALLSYFPSNGFMFRAVRCFDVERAAAETENSMPVFMVVCTKFKASPMKVLELNLGSSEKMQRYDKEDDVLTHVLSVQRAAFICSGLRRSSIANENEVVLDLFQVGGDVPRYTVYVVDVPPNKDHADYAGFIVPEGREAEWLFSTEAGRKNLVRITKHNRLAIITLHRDNVYESFEAVQTELSDMICSLAPSSLNTKKIAFLSLGSDVGHRTVKHRGTSELSGDFVVEDVVTENGDKYRRLFYLSSQLVVQSEARLRTIKTRRGPARETVDPTYLGCRHHVYMSLAATVACSSARGKRARVSVVGLGGGGLCSFLRRLLPKGACVLGVDYDAAMLDVAREWFDFKEDDRLRARVQDGLAYLDETLGNGEQVEALLYDMDNKDPSIGLSCPPRPFLDDENLEKASKVVGSNGLFVVNVVLREEPLRPGIIAAFRRHFATVLSYKLHEDLNEIFVCSNDDESEELHGRLVEGCRELNGFIGKHGSVDDGIDVERFGENLVAHS